MDELADVSARRDPGHHADLEDCRSDLDHRGYRDLDPVSGDNIYLLRNAHKVAPFMKEVLRRLNWQKFDWESWSDEAGTSQVELNFVLHTCVYIVMRVF